MQIEKLISLETFKQNKEAPSEKKKIVLSQL